MKRLLAFCLFYMPALFGVITINNKPLSEIAQESIGRMLFDSLIHVYRFKVGAKDLGTVLEVDGSKIQLHAMPKEQYDQLHAVMIKAKNSRQERHNQVYPFPLTLSSDYLLIDDFLIQTPNIHFKANKVCIEQCVLKNTDEIGFDIFFPSEQFKVCFVRFKLNNGPFHAIEAFSGNSFLRKTSVYVTGVEEVFFVFLKD